MDRKPTRKLSWSTTCPNLSTRQARIKQHSQIGKMVTMTFSTKNNLNSLTIRFLLPVSLPTRSNSLRSRWENCVVNKRICNRLENELTPSNWQRTCLRVWTTPRPMARISKTFAMLRTCRLSEQRSVLPNRCQLPLSHCRGTFQRPTNATSRNILSPKVCWIRSPTHEK